ncbi:hypothetical protein L5515_008313 [Caenorhabditis briggsae]|uniref:G-protein coupled receptors family 1 profile domain-containing protein n=1 Tax=Caenorhabditis briggsae TaxID=6238 RepID=A0AAE9F114_CAEBR|nr:hypothetical protein L5515_008313 [Caenorhabditis briggsae]
MISTIAHTICLVSELICVKLKLRFTQTHRDECFRSVVVYMFAVLFQSTLFLMMAIDLFLAVIMPIRHKLWRRGPYLFVLCIPPLLFSCFALFIEEIYINHDDLLICTVTLAAPPTVRFWGTLVTFSTIFLAVTLIFITAFKVHANERESARRILRHSNSITSNTKCSDAKLLKSLSTLMFVFICSWSLSILLSHVSLYFTKSIAYEIQKYNILLSLPTFCQNFFVTGLRSPRYAKAYAEQLSFLPFVSQRDLLGFQDSPTSRTVSSNFEDGGGQLPGQLPTDLDYIESDIKKTRRLLNEIPDPSQNRVQFFKLDDNGYAFSAYTDNRKGNMGHKYVRILVFLTKFDDFSCEINSKKSYVVTLYELSENHNMKWKMYILNCLLPDGITFNDVNSVKISRSSSKLSVQIPIRHRIQDEKMMTPDEYDYKLSICVPALFGNVYYPRRIIEFVELNSLQDIDKIYIYYNPLEMTDEATERTLKFYSDNGKINLMEFILPFSTLDVWYYGQLATVTDCLLRNTGITQYTFFNDLDEFFVPVLDNQTLSETVSGLFENRKIASQRTALKFISTKINRSPVTLNNSVSSKNFETRFTKCVVRPEMVFEQGIHHTSRVIQDDYETPSHDGSLLRVYHYREPRYCCENENLLKQRYDKKLQEVFDAVVLMLEV